MFKLEIERSATLAFRTEGEAMFVKVHVMNAGVQTELDIQLQPAEMRALIKAGERTLRQAITTHYIKRTSACTSDSTGVQ